MRAEIITELEALEVHYFRPVRSPEERQRWLRDYLDDLGEFSIDQIRSACVRWRQSGARKFPNSGELRAFARDVVRPSSAPKEGPWRPLSDEEYERLSLSDKIRPQRILAEEAAQRAGPQMIDRRPIPAEEMPDRWHMWRNRSANHQAEVKRLLKLLHDAKDMRA